MIGDLKEEVNLAIKMNIERKKRLIHRIEKTAKTTKVIDVDVGQEW